MFILIPFRYNRSPFHQPLQNENIIKTLMMVKYRTPTPKPMKSNINDVLKGMMADKKKPLHTEQAPKFNIIPQSLKVDSNQLKASTDLIQSVNQPISHEKKQWDLPTRHQLGEAQSPQLLNKKREMPEPQTLPNNALLTPLKKRSKKILAPISEFKLDDNLSDCENQVNLCKNSGNPSCLMLDFKPEISPIVPLPGNLDAESFLTESEDQVLAQPSPAIISHGHEVTDPQTKKKIKKIFKIDSF